MKFIFVLVAVVALAALYFNSGSEERVELLRQQAQRVDQQDAILGRLRAMNDEKVTQLATDWREAYPNPSSKRLSELREIEQRLMKDKSAAEKMTVAYKEKNNVFCSGQVTSTIAPSSEPSCKPGL